MAPPNRSQNDVDTMFGLLSQRMDHIEYHRMPRLEPLIPQMGILDNKISVLQAKTQSLVERVNRHVPALSMHDVFPLTKDAKQKPADEETVYEIASQPPDPQVLSESPAPANTEINTNARSLPIASSPLRGRPQKDETTGLLQLEGPPISQPWLR